MRHRALTEEQRRCLAWASAHLSNVKMTDVVPAGAYSVPEVWRVLRDVEVEGLPAASDPVTASGVRLLARLAAECLLDGDEAA